MKSINVRGVINTLSDSEMKMVKGGKYVEAPDPNNPVLAITDDGGGNSGVNGSGGGGTCGYNGLFHNYHDGWPDVWVSECGVSKSYVLSLQSSAVPGTFNWCCDSCGTSSYCGG